MANKNIGSITTSFNLDTSKYKDGLIKVEAQTKVFTEKIKRGFNPLTKTFRDLKSMMIGAFSIAAITQTVRYFDTIEKSVLRMEAGITKARKGTADFASIAKGIYTSLPISIDQATGAVGALAAKTKLTGEALKMASEQAAALNGLTGGNDATSSVLMAMKKWGVEQENFTKFSNILYTVSKNAGMGADGIKTIADGLVEANDTLGKFGFTVEQSAAFMGDLLREGENVNDTMSALSKAVVKLSSQKGVAGLAGGWKKLKEEMDGAATHAERLEIASKYFGDKKAVAMTDIFENANISLGGAALSMESIVGDLKSTETPLDKMQKSIEKIATSLSSIVGYFENIGQTIDKYNIFGAVSELAFGGVKLGRGALTKDKIYPQGNAGLVGSTKSFDLGTITRYTSTVKDATKAQEEFSTASGTIGNVMADTEKRAMWTHRSLEDLFGNNGNMPVWQDNIESLGKGLRDNLTDSFTSIIMQTQSVSEAFKAMAVSILESISRIVMEQTIANPIAQALTNMVGSIGGSMFGGSSGSSSYKPSGNLYSGYELPPMLTFAEGGIPPVGVPSIVGENGPELFVPSTAGRIVPNDSLGSGSSNVYITQNNNFSGGNSQSILESLNKAKAQLVAAVADEISRGGGASRKLRAA